jgi:hypothetical protein
VQVATRFVEVWPYVGPPLIGWMIGSWPESLRTRAEAEAIVSGRPPEPTTVPKSDDAGRSGRHRLTDTSLVVGPPLPIATHAVQQRPRRGSSHPNQIASAASVPPAWPTCDPEAMDTVEFLVVTRR